jgi:hypothetical protein
VIAQPPSGITPSPAGGQLPLNAYQYDDGVTEAAVAIVGCSPQGPATLLWLHSFDAVGDLDTITCICTAFGSPIFAPNAPPNGAGGGVGLWEDPDDDGDPSDAVLLAAAFTPVQQGDTDRLNAVPIPPTVVSGKFFAGAWSEQLCGPTGFNQYPGPLDRSVASLGRAWLAASLPPTPFQPVNLNALSIPPVELDSIGLPGVWLLRAVGGTLEPVPDASDLDSLGTDFVVAMIDHPSFVEQPQFKLVFDCDVSTVVHVDYPLNSPTFSTNVTVPAGVSTVLVLPLAAEQWPVDAISNNAVHAYGPDPFVLTLLSKDVGSSDSAIAIPTDTLGRNYIVSDYEPDPSLLQGYESEFVVFAVEDDTTVVIIPTANLVGGHPQGLQTTFVLDRGQGYKARPTGLVGLMGSIVFADKPIGVINGTRGTQIPTGIPFAEKVFEMAVPEEYWGRSFRLANLPNRTDGRYRVLACRNGTQCRKNGIPFGPLLNRGQYHQFDVVGDFSISANAPVCVIQYEKGCFTTTTNLGDASMLNVVPWVQYVPRQIFSTPKHTEFAPGGLFGALKDLVLGYQHYATITAWTADVGSLTLDNVLVPAASFKAIPGTDFHVARMPVGHGAHVTSSSRHHGITVESYGLRGTFTNPGLSRYASPGEDCGDCPGPTTTIHATAGTGGTVVLDQPSAAVGRNWIVEWETDNALAHSFDAGGRVATSAMISFVDANPRAGAWNATIDVPPVGGGPVSGCIRIRESAPFGTYPYTMTLFDQWGERFGEIGAQLVVQ